MIFRRKNKPSRHQQLAQLAPSLRMQFAKDDKLQVLPLLLDFKLFRIGGAKKIKNLMWQDEEDLRTRIFDYQYTVSTGNSSQTFRQTVFFFYSKELGLPTFRLQPEKLIHKIGSLIGFDDLDFETHEKFSRSYHLKGEDEELVRQTFTDSVLQFFTFNPDWSVEGLNYFLIIYKRNKRFSPADIAKHFRTAHKIFDVLRDEGFDV